MMPEREPRARPAVLIVDQFADVGGAQRVLLDLLPALSELYRPVCAIPGGGDFARELEARGIRWVEIAAGNYGAGRKSAGDIARFALRQPQLAAGLHRLVEQLQPALIYANGPRVFPAAAAAARAARVPLLWHLHLIVGHARDRVLLRTAALLAQPSVVACSRACLDPFPARTLLRRRATVIPNGVRAVAVPRPADMPPHPVIAVVGRIHPDKGQHLLLAAAGQIRKAVPGARFSFVGGVQDEAYAKTLRARAAAFPGGVVLFRGAVRGPEAWAGEADLVVVPGSREASSLVAAEAFSAGIPVIGAAAGGIPEMIEPWSNGLLFTPGDARALARAAIRVLTDEELRRNLTAGALQSYRQRWTLERFQREMLGQIERQTGLPRPGPEPPARRTAAHTRA